MTEPVPNFEQVDPPDGTARASALAIGGADDTVAHAGGPFGLGRLSDVGAWLAGCQGSCPPRPITDPQVVVFAADHGVAKRGVSTRAAGSTPDLLAALHSGAHPIATFAEGVSARVHVIDIALDHDSAAPTHIRRSSGSIDVADALSDDEVHAAIRAGIAVADAQVDAGADLLVACALGAGSTTPAATLVAALTGAEPVAVVGRGSGIDDEGWMRKAAAVRDALRRARPHLAEPLALLRTAGGGEIAALAGFLAQAALRRTPVLLDGLVVTAAAMIADELAPGAKQWWLATHRTLEPAHDLALEHLGLEPLLSLNCGTESGVAVAAVPMIAMATQVLAEATTQG